MPSAQKISPSFLNQHWAFTSSPKPRTSPNTNPIAIVAIGRSIDKSSTGSIAWSAEKQSGIPAFGGESALGYDLPFYLYLMQHTVPRFLRLMTALDASVAAPRSDIREGCLVSFSQDDYRIVEIGNLIAGDGVFPTSQPSVMNCQFSSGASTSTLWIPASTSLRCIK